MKSLTLFLGFLRGYSLAWIRLSLLLLFVGLGSSGCFVKEQQCNSDEDCKATSGICQERLCVLPKKCIQDKDCQAGQTCSPSGGCLAAKKCTPACEGARTCDISLPEPKCVCVSGLTDCSGACVDLEINSAHCGACGTSCRDKRGCVKSACQCPSGLEDCGGTCVNLQTEPQNCGACGKTCPPNEVCSQGVCKSNCAASETNCSSRCADLTSDKEHCGACQQKCLFEQSCKASKCECPAGRSVCGDKCVDLQTDPQNCGACGKTCGTGELCQTEGGTLGCYPPAGAELKIPEIPGGVARYIPAGTYNRGSPLSELGRGADEIQHAVTISRGFWMLQTEVTQAQYKALMGENPSDVNGCFADLCPVHKVSFEKARTFANNLSDKQKLAPCTAKDRTIFACKGWRLPTDAEWEYAARAGTTTAFHTGACITRDDAVFDGTQPYPNCKGGDKPGVSRSVEASATKNAWNLAGMHGNVWEWTLDGETKYTSDPVTDPFSSSDGTKYLVRGGGYSDSGSDLRSAHRRLVPPTADGTDLGFRLIRIR